MYSKVAIILIQCMDMGMGWWVPTLQNSNTLHPLRREAAWLPSRLPCPTQQTLGIVSCHAVVAERQWEAEEGRKGGVVAVFCGEEEYSSYLFDMKKKKWHIISSIYNIIVSYASARSSGMMTGE